MYESVPCYIHVSYTISHENWVVGNRYSRLLFIGRFFVHAITMAEYDVTMPALRVQRRPSLANKRSMIVLACLCARSGHKIACKKYNDVWVTVNTDFCHS